MASETNYPVPSIGSGLTLYSLTSEQLSGNWPLERVLREIAARGIGPGVEVVGFQSLRGYPDVADGLVEDWLRLVDELGLVPTALSSNVDVALRSDRFLDDDEMADYMIRQLHVAKRMRFPIVRIQVGASSGVIRRITPVAERLGLRVGMELHSPTGPRTPDILEVRELFAELDSEALGFVPDFSATMRGIPATEQRQWVEAGLPESLLAPFIENWRKPGGDPHTKLQAFGEIAAAEGVPSRVWEQTLGAFTMHGTQPIESWYDIADQIIHVHGKCYEFDENGDEPSIDYAAIAKVLVDIDYHGYVSTEWEGHTFLSPDVSGFDQVAAHQRLLSRALSDAVAARG